MRERISILPSTERSLTGFCSLGEKANPCHYKTTAVLAERGCWEKEIRRGGLGLFCGGASLTDHAFDRFGWLCADLEPFVGQFEVDVEVRAFFERVIGA